MSNRGALGVADRLALAAAPIFGSMALLTRTLGDDRVAALCTQAGLPSPLSGMTFMYLLMAVFHLPPWLRVIASRTERRDRRISEPA